MIVPLLLGASPATTAAAPADQDQLEVTADKSLEWYKDKNLYVARGKARAVKGDKVVEADLLTAHETTEANQAAKNKSGKGKMGKIDYLTADGNVVITDPQHRISGDKGFYDVVQGMAKVTGSNLKYESETDTVTAKDSLEYWEETRTAVARGKAVAKNPSRRVEADVLTAQFAETGDGQNKLSKLTAEGHVNVITINNGAAGDVARGDHGVYDMDRNVAVLTGHVRITRADGTQLNGDRGEVDFNTNQSRLLNTGAGGRVRVLLPAKGSAKDGAKDMHQTVGAGVLTPARSTK